MQAAKSSFNSQVMKFKDGGNRCIHKEWRSENRSDPCILFQKSFYGIGDVLLDIVKFYIKVEYFLKACRRSIVFPLPKLRKSCYLCRNGIQSTYSVAQASYVRIVQQRLSANLNDNTFIVDERYSFRNRRNTLYTIVKPFKASRLVLRTTVTLQHSVPTKVWHSIKSHGSLVWK